jgi:hypothetical protein
MSWLGLEEPIHVVAKLSIFPWFPIQEEHLFLFSYFLCSIWEKQGGKDKTLAVTSTGILV